MSGQFIKQYNWFEHANILRKKKSVTNVDSKWPETSVDKNCQKSPHRDEPLTSTSVTSLKTDISRDPSIYLCRVEKKPSTNRSKILTKKNTERWRDPQQNAFVDAVKFILQFHVTDLFSTYFVKIQRNHKYLNKIFDQKT
jgi:hypothetical protein